MSESANECPICQESCDDTTSQFKAACGHAMCGNCAIKLIERDRRAAKCSLCRADLFTTLRKNADGTWSRTDDNGDVMTGAYVDGMFVGECVCVAYNGHTLRGNVVNGEFDGLCVKTEPSGTLTGMFKNKKFEGECIIRNDGLEAIGCMVASKFVGTVKRIFYDTAKPTVIYETGANSAGTMRFRIEQNGDELRGIIGESGHITGAATVTRVNGDVIRGERRNGEWVGDCTLTRAADGAVLVGTCADEGHVFTEHVAEAAVAVAVSPPGRIARRRAAAKASYERRKQTPEFVAKQKERYQRKKQNADFVQQTRAKSLAYYYARKAQKPATVVDADSAPNAH